MLYFILLLVAAALAGVVAALITASSLWAWISTGLSVVALLLLAADWFRRRSRGVPSDARAEDLDPAADPQLDDSDEVDHSAAEDAVAADGAPGEDDVSAEEEPVEQFGEEEPTEVVAAATDGDSADTGSSRPSQQESERPTVADLSQDADDADRANSQSDEPAQTASADARADESASDDAAADAPDEPEPEPVADAAETTSRVAADPDSASSVPDEESTSAEDARVVAGLDAEVLVVDEYPRYHLAVCDWLTERETIPIAVSEARDLGFTPCVQCAPDAGVLANHRNRRKKFRARAGR